MVCLPGCKRGHCAQTDRQTGAERLNPPPTDNPPHTNNPGTSQKDLMPPFLNDVVFLAFWVIFVGWNKTNHSSHVLPPIWETRPWWVGDTQTTVDLVVALFGIAPKVHRCAHCVHVLRSQADDTPKDITNISNLRSVLKGPPLKSVKVVRQPDPFEGQHLWPTPHITCCMWARAVLRIYSRMVRRGFLSPQPASAFFHASTPTGGCRDEVGEARQNRGGRNFSKTVGST